MAARILVLGTRQLKAAKVPIGAAGAHGNAKPGSEIWERTKTIIGDREIVGYGMNGAPMYVDRPDFPFPSIRWKEPSKDVLTLQEKEKGDWKKLSLEEKKALYRFSYRQTFSEFKAPTGQWKSVIGWGLFGASIGLWLFFAMKFFIYPPLPASFSEESQKAQLRRMLDLRVNPIEGLASEWDYEKDDWKK